MQDELKWGREIKTKTIIEIYETINGMSGQHLPFTFGRRDYA